MFDNYNNISGDYVPTNTNKCCRQNIPFIKVPNVDYDANGNVIGYFWYYGDTMNIRVELYGSINVPEDSIVYTSTGQRPDSSTVGYVNQKAYNVIDLISWTCTAIVESETVEYTWTIDSEFVYPTTGKGVYFTIDNYLRGRTVRATLYNYKHEQVDSRILEGSSIVDYRIDAELSAKLIRGTYYLTIVICDQNRDSYITAADDIMLTVK